ncbi:mitochondrial import receptor subunit TOM40 homolog, partial [Melanaphis sacchari]|uniref:mitochondrial import receptor subunit TOM40 homolog n=1 Tax=Melanaphis sacchari TaxID=742174 RepID=UPI000DC15A6B
CPINLDYWFPDRTLFLSIDLVLKDCSFQILQSVTDELSLGLILAFKRDTPCDLDKSHLQPKLVAKYAGPSYLVSGRLNMASGATKLAYYRHCTDWLQTGTTVNLDPACSEATSRLAFRIISDTSVFRAAIDTKGIVSSLWEKRLRENRLTVSLSSFLNHSVDNYGVGIGLSFE